MDDLNTGHLNISYSDVSVIQMFIIQIPTAIRFNPAYFLLMQKKKKKQLKFNK